MSEAEILERLRFVLSQSVGGLSVNMDAPRRADTNLPKNQSWTLRQLLAAAEQYIGSAGE